MELKILDTNFNTVAIIDEYISLIWTDRYDEAGDFEIYIPMDIKLLDVLKEDYYVTTDESDRVMIIDTIKSTSDEDEGDCLIVTGKSLEIILNRRIVLDKITFDLDDNSVLPNLQNGIKTILTNNIINPAIVARQIPNFIFEDCTDKAVTSLTLEAQYYGDNIYDVIKTLCVENRIGFRILLNDNNQFVFKLYAGADRSYEQTSNPYVVFSPEYDNLIDTNYYKSKSSYKNVCVVAGETIEDGVTTESDEDAERYVHTEGTAVGLERREIFADASDITHSVDEDTTLTEAQYRAHLKKRGIDTLIENVQIEAFEGEIETTTMYEYGKDFFMGDIVQLVDKYGHEARAYISEFIISHDMNGVSIYPTFIKIEKGVYDE